MMQPRFKERGTRFLKKATKRMRIQRGSAGRKPGSGISLTEVLISMGILTFGLLGAAALFPVGGHYLRQSDVSDRADAIAQAALSDAVARGMLDPENWMAVRVGSTSEPWVSAFDTPFGPAMRSELGARAIRLSPGNTDTDTDADIADRRGAIREINQLFGSIYVIDPIGIAEAMSSNTAFNDTAPAGLLSRVIGNVPASTSFEATFNNNINVALPGWAPWNTPTGAWPVRRLSVATGALRVRRRPVVPMLPQAREMASTDDDLSVQTGNYDGNPYDYSSDNPSQQLWNATNDGPLNRKSRGDFSWLMTVVPTTPQARDGLATDPESFNYDVSAVVSYKRLVGGEYDQEDEFFGHQSAMLGERVVRAAVASPGIGGGQLRLFTDTNAEMDAVTNAESPLEKLRAGQWAMLFGPHPDSSSDHPLLFCQWYRVVALESDDQSDGALFLRGPDWPWTPTNINDAQNANGVQNDLRLVIMPDVVAVHTRTMKLQPGAAWGID